MAQIFAEGVEISIEEGHWRLFNIEGSNSLTPFFDTLRGTGLIHYVPKFGAPRGLPGDVLATDYVEAVVTGYDEKRGRWVIGLHIRMQEDEKARFVPIVQWPSGKSDESGPVAHQTARVLADYLARPLKLFGAKAPAAGPAEGGVLKPGTGPLRMEKRGDVEGQKLQFKASLIKLPLSRYGIWLGGNRSSLTLRLDKNVIQDADVRYSQIVFDRDAQNVRLMQGTGLLTALRASQGRTIQFRQIRNVELRRTVFHETALERDSDGMVVDHADTVSLYGVYLTLEGDESILLTQLRHVKKGKPVPKQNKFGIDAINRSADECEQEMVYLREQQRDQQIHDSKADFLEAVSIVIANLMNRAVTKTELGDAVLINA